MEQERSIFGFHHAVQDEEAPPDKTRPRRRHCLASKASWRGDGPEFGSGSSAPSPESTSVYPADASTEPGSEADDEWSGALLLDDDDSSDDERTLSKSAAAMRIRRKSDSMGKLVPAFPSAEVRTAEWREVGRRLASVFKDASGSDSDHAEHISCVAEAAFSPAQEYDSDSTSC
mmetsp:Transcript_21661/g.49322  ORF Transcript_21661/g.49322 Transcript_21661/m.49322 type:complete len:174 (+) Transcript_21661:48-569(+)